MSGCRISKVTEKATGKTLRILPTPQRSEFEEVLIEALEMARRTGADGVAVAMTRPGDTPWSISAYTDHPAQLAGACEWVKNRVMGTME